MTLLRQFALILFVVGLLGLLLPGLIPAAEFIRWAILLAVVIVVVDLLRGRAAL